MEKSRSDTSSVRGVRRRGNQPTPSPTTVKGVRSVNMSPMHCICGRITTGSPIVVEEPVIRMMPHMTELDVEHVELVGVTSVPSLPITLHKDTATTHMTNMTIMTSKVVMTVIH